MYSFWSNIFQLENSGLGKPSRICINKIILFFLKISRETTNYGKPNLVFFCKIVLRLAWKCPDWLELVLPHLLQTVHQWMHGWGHITFFCFITEHPTKPCFCWWIVLFWAPGEILGRSPKITVWVRAWETRRIKIYWHWKVPCRSVVWSSTLFSSCKLYLHSFLFWTQVLSHSGIKWKGKGEK